MRILLGMSYALRALEGTWWKRSLSQLTLFTRQNKCCIFYSSWMPRRWWESLGMITRRAFFMIPHFTSERSSQPKPLTLGSRGYQSQIPPYSCRGASLNSKSCLWNPRFRRDRYTLYHNSRIEWSVIDAVVGIDGAWLQRDVWNAQLSAIAFAVFGRIW